jgi:excisionase family DNA binding protein
MTAAGLMTIREAAAHLGVSEKTVRRCIAAGQLKPTNVGAGTKVARWMVRRQELDAFLARRTKTVETERTMPTATPGRKRPAWRGESALAPDGSIPRRKPKPPALRLVK